MSFDLDAGIARNIAKSGPRPATKDELRDRLVAIFRLAKAGNDAEDGAEADALLDEECAASNALSALESDDIYMPAAKLIIATAGEIFLGIDDESLCRDERLKAQAAHGALRLFELEDLYHECFPGDGNGREARLDEARRWIKAAILTGHDPKMVQNRSWSSNPGQWQMHFSLTDNIGPLPPMPEGLKEEFIEVCRGLGRLYPDHEAEAAS
jgi:hypothetical protein